MSEINIIMWALENGLTFPILKVSESDMRFIKAYALIVDYDLDKDDKVMSVYKLGDIWYRFEVF